MKFCLTAAGMCEESSIGPYRYTQPNGHLEQILEKVRSGIRIIVEHIDRNKVIYRIGALTLIVLLGGMDIVSAAADAGIDASANKIYTKLVSIGKWVIIIKGAFDSISSTVQGDFISARKSALSYLVVYLILLGLPWAFGQIEDLFQGMV